MVFVMGLGNGTTRVSVILRRKDENNGHRDGRMVSVEPEWETREPLNKDDDDVNFVQFVRV